MKSRASTSVTSFAVSLAILLGLVVIVSMVLERAELSAPARFGLALLPVAAYALCLASYAGLVRQTDELQRRVHFEALAFAFPTTAVAVLASEYFEKAGLITRLEPDYLLLVMLALWATGLVVAWRRYR